MPAKLSDAGSESVHFRAPPAQVAKLDRTAARERKNRSLVIRELIKVGFEARATEHLIASAELERTYGKASED